MTCRVWYWWIASDLKGSGRGQDENPNSGQTLAKLGIQGAAKDQRTLTVRSGAGQDFPELVTLSHSCLGRSMAALESQYWDERWGVRVALSCEVHRLCRLPVGRKPFLLTKEYGLPQRFLTLDWIYLSMLFCFFVFVFSLDVTAPDDFNTFGQELSIASTLLFSYRCLIL